LDAVGQSQRVKLVLGSVDPPGVNSLQVQLFGGMPQDPARLGAQVTGKSVSIKR